jgi:3-oxoacyl-[acyl-carrier protein] reductase
VTDENDKPTFNAGKVALITGAGGGIGAQTARKLAETGAQLVLADLREEPLHRTAAAMHGPQPLVWAGDLSVEGGVKRLFRQVQDRFGRLDIAVNAAGMLAKTPLEQITKDEWDRVMSVNAGSCFLVCRECCAPMRRQGWGRVVNFSSLAGQTGGIMAGAHYSAAKAAVISITRSMAKLMAPHGVRVNCLAPAGVETDMLRQFDDEAQASLLAGIPIGRFGTAAEVAEAVVWLTSPASDFITGQTINVNGGAYLG